jgi:PAS domain S-box-containing protein
MNDTQEPSEPQATASNGALHFSADLVLTTIFGELPDRMYVKDTQSRFLKISHGLAKRIGVANPADAIGKTDHDFYLAEHAAEFLRDEQRVLQTGEPVVNKVEKQITLNGEVAWASVTKVALRDAAGNITGLIGINRDITEYKLAEEELRRSRDELENRVVERIAELSQERRLLRTLVDHLPDAIYAKDAAGRKTLANTADLKNLRCRTEADAIGKSDFDLFPPDIAAKFFADDQAVIAGTPVINREEYFFDEEGAKHWLLTSKLPVRDQNGAIVGLVGVGRDITSLKTAEEKLAAVNKELREVSRQAGMAEVATGVLHNVGNVLNSVNVAADLIGDRLRNSKAAGVSRLSKLLVEHEADLAKFLTEDERGRQIPAYLKQLADHLDQERAELREELHRLNLNIEHIKEIVATQQNYARVLGVAETVKVADLVEDALKIHGAAYERHGIKLERDYDALPTISVDKHKVMQIIVNLLSNAKYACDATNRADKKVTVRLKPIGSKQVRIQVTDNGMGIPKENLTRIFAHGFTTRKNGHGFGLHSGALAAKELGGALSVHSEGAGHGATFTLELPLAPVVVRRQSEPA